MHHLEPEDLRALTLEASLITGLPLAGTNRVFGGGPGWKGSRGDPSDRAAPCPPIVLLLSLAVEPDCDNFVDGGQPFSMERGGISPVCDGSTRPKISREVGR